MGFFDSCGDLLVVVGWGGGWVVVFVGGVFVLGVVGVWEIFV